MQQQEMLQQFTRLVETLTGTRREDTARPSHTETGQDARGSETAAKSEETSSARPTLAPRLFENGAATEHKVSD